MQVLTSIQRTLTRDILARSAPAVFATSRDMARTGDRYRFINTEQILAGMLDAGFHVTYASQTRVRKGGAPEHAKHLLRFAQLRESVILADAIPEIVLINSHNGTSAYTLRAGLYRPVCTNGLVTPIGDFGVLQVPHRGNIVENVVSAAINIASQFEAIGTRVERMTARVLQEAERMDFARRALAIRFPDAMSAGYPLTEAQLLGARRTADYGNTLWQTYNVVQENLMRGGLSCRTATGRQAHTRGLRAIRETVRVNVGLWDLAVARCELAGSN